MYKHNSKNSSKIVSKNVLKINKITTTLYNKYLDFVYVSITTFTFKYFQ